MDKKQLKQRVAKLEQERDYLDARLEQFEKLARKFVKCKYPDSIIRLRFQALLNEEDSCSGGD